MGHHAKCLGLREAPSSVGRVGFQPKPEKPRNRLTIEEKREPFKQPRFKPKTLAMATSTLKKSRGTRVAATGNRFSAGGSMGGEDLRVDRTLGGPQSRFGQKGRSKSYQDKKGYDFAKGLRTAKVLTVSEFDSGLPPLKKRKHN